MKKSKQINIVFLSALAISLLPACEEGGEVKHCVDETDKVVEEHNCTTTSGTPPIMPHYRWYYGGNTILSPGTRVVGGSYTPAPGKSYSPPSTISRGGFGATGGHVGSTGGGE